ncbi:Sm-like protein lsm7 [Coccomyxa viridis]|uniref:Sm-like protein lsm7 n=1 Tax=Coccomyxa viridis TaxID=1274662 RepID=A0AAV1I218_9CHLO|nr:Sm-like protein lsm7 [Coccomyxa viridis]
MLLDGLLESNHTLYNCHRVSQVLQSVGQLISAVLSWPAVEGVLKGYDQLLNLVLDETVEYSRDKDDMLRITDETRPMGLVVCRGTAVMMVSPTAGTEELAQNPFKPDDE